jgi:ornithine cyclodeaminase
MRIIDEGAIRAVASLSQVRSAVRGALESLARGTVVQPDVNELQHALAAGLLRKDDVWAELGDILIGRRPGRTDDLEVTVADLTGVGVLDAAVAELVVDATGS